MEKEDSALPVKGISGFSTQIARFGVFIIFGLMVIFFALSNPHFFTVDNFLLIIQQASPLGIAVVGMIYVLVVAGIDISVGSTMYFVAVIIAMLTYRYDIITVQMLDNIYGYFIVYLIAIAIGIVIGLLNGFLATKFRILPFIVTLSTLNILRGFGYMISQSTIQQVSSLSGFSNSKIGFVPVVFMFFIAIVLIFDFILRKCVFGRHLMAIGNSNICAKTAGININRNIVISYVICGALAAFAGVISAGQIGSVALNFGEGNEFIVISAAVLGGTSLFGGKGTVFPGAIIGILLITTIMNGLAMINASPYVYTIFRAIIIFLAVMLDSIHYKGDLR